MSKLKLLKASHTSQIYRLESDIAKRYPMEIAATKERIAGLKSDLAAAKPILEQDKDQFQMVVGGKTYTDRKEAGLAIIAACAGLKAVNTTGQIGEYQGFSMTASFDSFNQKYMLTIKRQCSYTIEIGKDALGNIQRINNALAGIEKKLPEAETKLETLQSQLATAKEEVAKPFPQAAELEEKTARLAELNTMLNMDSKVSNDVIGLDEEDNPEQEVADRPKPAMTYADRAAAAAAPSVEGMETNSVQALGSERLSGCLPERSDGRTSVLARLHDKQSHQAERVKLAPSQNKKREQEI